MIMEIDYGSDGIKSCVLCTIERRAKATKKIMSITNNILIFFCVVGIFVYI